MEKSRLDPFCQGMCPRLNQMPPPPPLPPHPVPPSPPTPASWWPAFPITNAAIATILDISPETAKTYSKRIYAKLDVSDRVGAVVKALRLGLVKV